MTDAISQLLPDLLRAGSLEAYAAQVGDEAAAQVYHHAVLRTPEELRPSWPMVIAYQRMQKSYEEATDLGLREEAVKIAAAMAKLVREVY